MRGLYVLSYIILLISAISCEKDEVLIEDQIKQEGHIEVKVSGKGFSGEVINMGKRLVYYPVNYEDDYMGMYKTKDSINFKLGRVEDITLSDFAHIYFTTTPDYDSTYNVYIEVKIRSGNQGKITLYESNSSSSLITPTVNIESFDSTSGRMKGDYTFSSGINDNIAVVTGEFDITFREIIW